MEAFQGSEHDDRQHIQFPAIGFGAQVPQQSGRLGGEVRIHLVPGLSHGGVMAGQAPKLVEEGMDLRLAGVLDHVTQECLESFRGLVGKGGRLTLQFAIVSRDDMPDERLQQIVLAGKIIGEVADADTQLTGDPAGGEGGDYEGDHPKPFEHYSDYPGYMDRETNSYTAKLDWELGDSMDLVSITNYFDLDKFYTEDGDGIPVPIIQFTTVADFTQFSQELRLSGEADRFRWVVGGFWLDMETDADVITGGAPVAGVAVELGFDPETLSDPAVIQDYKLESQNWSVFGQGEYDLTETLRLVVGLRWSQDDKDMDFRTSFAAPEEGILVPDLFNLQEAAKAAGSDNDTVDYGDWAGRLRLDWDMSDDTLAYASINRGIKGGNFAPSANVGLDNIRHDEEVLYAYELGFKTQFADGLARLNAAIFYYDYEDYQAFTFSDGTPSIANADATNYGGEVELVVMPDEHWDILLGLSLQDSEVDGVETPQQQVTPVGFPVDWPIDFLDGNELPNTPTYSFNYLVRYNFDALAGNIALQVDGAYHDDQYLEVSNAAGALQEAYGAHNARISWWGMDEKLRLSAWVKNFTDEEYKMYALDLGILGATTTYAPPMTYGITAGYHF